MSADIQHVRPASNRRLSWREVPWILVLGLALSLHLWFPRIDSEPLNDTYSADVGGRNAFYQLTEHRAPSVERNLEPLYRAVDRLDTELVLCLLGPARYPNEREWSAVLNWVAEGGHLLFAARWDDSHVEIPYVDAEIEQYGKVAEKNSSATDKPAEKTPPAGGEKQQPDLQKADRAGSPESESKPVAESLEEKKVPEKETDETRIETTLTPPELLKWESRGVVVLDSDSEGEVLVRNTHGPQVVRLKYGEGTIVICASDQLFSNSSLFDRKHENGMLAARILESAGARHPVVFDESLNVSGTPQVVGLLLDPHLRPMTIQLLVLLVVFGWRGGRRFGRLLPRGSAVRHNLSDHTDALGNLYYKTKNGLGALRGYLEQLKRQLRLHLTADRGVRSLGPLAQRSGMPVEEVKNLLSEAEALAARPSVKRREAAAMILRLSKLRKPSARG